MTSTTSKSVFSLDTSSTILFSGLKAGVGGIVTISFGLVRFSSDLYFLCGCSNWDAISENSNGAVPTELLKEGVSYGQAPSDIRQSRKINGKMTNYVFRGKYLPK